MKKKKRQPREKSAPMLIMRGLVNDRLETRERMAVEAFAHGFASMDTFDTIADMQGVLLLAGSTSESRKPYMHYARDVLGTVLGGIKARYLRTGKMGCNAEELKVLRAFVTKYREFWLRQPMSLYEAACAQLQVTYNEMAKKADMEKAA